MNHPWKQDRRRLWVFRIVYLSLLLATVPVLLWNSFVGQFNASFSDILFRLRSPVRTSGVDSIVLVAIDDGTAARYGPLPLKRSLLAAGLDRIAEAAPRVLVIDLLISEPGPPGDDKKLAAALERFPRVVLSAALASDSMANPSWILPLAGLGSHAVAGHVHAAPDPDGSVRSVLLAKLTEDRRLWALALEACRLFLSGSVLVERADSIVLDDIRIAARSREDRRLRINYAGPEGAFRRVAFSAVLDGTANLAELRNRIVIVGVTAQGGGDRLFTPVSSGIGMSGIEIHANIARTILDRAFLVSPSPPAELALAASILSLCAFGTWRLRGWRLPLLWFSLAVAILTAGWLGLRSGYVWPVGSMLAVLMVASAVSGASEYGLVRLALRSSEEKRSEYAFRVQAIAHEIKTPLTAIQGQSELIADSTMPENERARMAGLLFRESKRLTQILHTFLDVERMASGSLKLEKRPVPLHDLCDEVVERGRLFASRKKTEIVADVPQLTVLADPELLSFAIYNLLTNAVKYSPKQTRITLRAEPSGGGVQITVSDEGYGIPPQDQQRIFDKFYRVSRDQTGTEDGAGVGLALVKEIAVQHGGKVTVESNLGQGSRFTIVLPEGMPPEEGAA
ncbi:MAG: CHASE2 domain-containing protein [Acidobacteria bacterium]|nr:CHASE2 domain-containing protein [Acidobacteriota bacterium]